MIAVSKPRALAVATFDRCLVLEPASTTHFLTSVEPFQLAYTVARLPFFFTPPSGL